MSEFMAIAVILLGLLQKHFMWQLASPIYSTFPASADNAALVAVTGCRELWFLRFSPTYCCLCSIFTHRTWKKCWKYYCLARRYTSFV